MQKYLAELIGTFILVFCGTGAVVINEVSPGAVTHIGIAITFGLVVMAMIYSIGRVSGAHLNPAVTIAFALSKRFSGKQIIPYIISQSAGALLASYCLKFLFPSSALLGATLPAAGSMQSFVLEIFLTLFLVFVVLQVAGETIAGVVIGSVVLLEAMFAGPVSGASMNPARSLAPALVSSHLEHLWVYLTAPFIGATIAVIVHKIVKE